MKRPRSMLVDSPHSRVDCASGYRSRKADKRGSPARSALTIFSERVDDIPLDEVLQAYSQASYLRTGGGRSLIHRVQREGKDHSVDEQKQQCTSAAQLVETLVQHKDVEHLSCPAAPEMSNRQSVYSQSILEAPLSPTDFLGRLRKRVGGTELSHTHTKGNRAAKLVQSHLNFSGDGLRVKNRALRDTHTGKSCDVGSQTADCESGSGSGGELEASLFAPRELAPRLDAEHPFGLSSAPARVHGDDLDKSASSLLMLLRGGSGMQREQTHGVKALVSLLVQSQPDGATKAMREPDAATDKRYSTSTLGGRRLARSVSTPGAGHSREQRSFPIKSASSRSFVVVSAAPPAPCTLQRGLGAPASRTQSSPRSPGGGREAKFSPGSPRRSVAWRRSFSEASSRRGDGHAERVSQDADAETGRAGHRSAQLHQATISQFISPTSGADAHAASPRGRLKQLLLVPPVRSEKSLVSTGCSTNDLLPEK